MLGMVGAGKGTQARKLSEYLKLPHISTGDIFRDAAEKKTPLGLQARQIMIDGGLVPDEIVLGIVRQRLGQNDACNGYILDGFPRTLNQAWEFEKTEKLDLVFYIDVPEEEVVQRLKGRRVCENCKAQYNVYLNPDLVKCIECGGKLKQREDDREETVRVRIKNYIRQTEPLISYYKEAGILKTINGKQDISGVFEEIKNFV